jgi:hypothetical protein
MGASVIAYWPGISEEQLESQPGFSIDRAWGNWMAVREDEPAVYEAIGKLRVDAILTFKTDGWDDEDVNWVTPEELRDAATKLREAVHAGSPETKVILDTYDRARRPSGRRSNPDTYNYPPVAEDFIQELDDIINITRWAEEEGATRITLEVNW